MRYFMKKSALLFALTMTLPIAAHAATATLHKDPNCGCCTAHGEHLSEHGFEVALIDESNVQTFKDEHNIPDSLRSCHTTVIDGYVFEGHVPAESIQRVLDEKPFIKGLSVPGMPMGTPGMGDISMKQGPVEVLEMAFQPTDSPRVHSVY